VDFKDLVRLARRRWKSIVSVFALALIASAAYSFTSTPIYQSQAKVFISTDVSDPAAAYYAAAFSTQRVQSYADLVGSRTVLEGVIHDLNLNLTPDELKSKVSASVGTNSVIITVTAKDKVAKTAQQIAQAASEQLTGYIADVEAPAGKTSTPVKATITDPAQFDSNPVSPRIVLNLGVAGVLGLLLGCALALVRDLLDSSIKTIDDIARVTDSPVMSHIVFDPVVPKSPLLTDVEARSPRAEAFRLLRTNLQFADLDAHPKSFVITSSVPEEGKTSTSTNLAIALAQAGQRVLLIDGDLRRPRIARILGLESAVGLTTVLVGRSQLTDSIQVHAPSGVSLLSSGPIPPNPTEILQSQATQELFRTLREGYDAVIIDAPPLLPVADAAIIAKAVDGAILVVRHGQTSQEQLRHATSRLDQVGARTYGVVVNMVPKRAPDYGYGGYGYGYGYGYTS
jgi:receptor protein-tyrosine kinase